MPGGIPTSRGVRRGGLGGLALLLLLLLGFCYGFDPGVMFQGDSVTNLPYETAPQVPQSSVDDEMGQFVPAAEPEPVGEGAKGGGEHQRRMRSESSRHSQSAAGARAKTRSRGIMRAR